MRLCSCPVVARLGNDPQLRKEENEKSAFLHTTLEKRERRNQMGIATFSSLADECISSSFFPRPSGLFATIFGLGIDLDVD